MDRGDKYYYRTHRKHNYSLSREVYAIGEIEILDEKGNVIGGGEYSVPREVASIFEDFINDLETDLPIHIGIGSNDWCEEEAANKLGIEVDLLRDIQTQEKYYEGKWEQLHNH
jgi:hypothetical protein